MKQTFQLEYQQALINLKSIRRQAREMLKKPETDDRIKTRLFIVIKDITESIMKLVLQGDAMDDTITFMEDKTGEVIEHMNSVKKEQLQQQHEQEDVEDQEIF
jgi:hypothetical protein